LLILGELVILDFEPVNFLKATLVDNTKGPLEPPQECLSQPDGYKKWTCFKSYFETFTEKFSAGAAMIEAMKLRSEGVISSCHILGHRIGTANLEKHNFDTGKAFSSCIRGCADGCFHGVLERYIRNDADPYNALAKITGICDSVGIDMVKKRQCIHGVGHGLRAHNYLSVQESINACDAFESEETDFWVNTCIGAVVMENTNQYLIQDLDEERFRDVIPEMCEQIPEFMIRDCIGSVALGILYYTGYDLPRSEGLCEELPNQQYVDMCKEDQILKVETEERDVMSSKRFPDIPAEDITGFFGKEEGYKFK